MKMKIFVALLAVVLIFMLGFFARPLFENSKSSSFQPEVEKLIGESKVAETPKVDWNSYFSEKVIGGDSSGRFSAPGKDDPPLKNTHDLVQAYLNAPNWEARLPYIYQADDLKDEIAAYYKKWPDNRLSQFKIKLFQMELDAEYGGPFWVYQILSGDSSNGPPLAIRVEDGDLKVDWQLYTEFSDQLFIKYKEGKLSAPQKLRLVAERVENYAGPDKDTFTDWRDYLCFRLDPPYGNLNEFSEFAFVKKGTAVAKKMSDAIRVGDSALALIITLDIKEFPHGIKHYIITDFVAEGWFE